MTLFAPTLRDFASLKPEWFRFGRPVRRLSDLSEVLHATGVFSGCCLRERTLPATGAITKVLRIFVSCFYKLQRACINCYAPALGQHILTLRIRATLAHHRPKTQQLILQLIFVGFKSHAITCPSLHGLFATVTLPRGMLPFFVWLANRTTFQYSLLAIHALSNVE